MKLNLEQELYDYSGAPIRQGETIKRMEELITALMAALPAEAKEPFITAYSQLPKLTLKDILLRACSAGLQNTSPDQLRAIHRIAKRFSMGPIVELNEIDAVMLRLAVSRSYNSPLYFGLCMDALDSANGGVTKLQEGEHYPGSG